MVQDRFRAGTAERGRVLESLEAALRVGRGRVNVHVVDDADPPRSLDCWRYSNELHCADCDLSYREPIPSLFSFNSPVGACETCRGFGRTIGIDYGLVIPDESKSLRGGAVRPWQTQSYKECQDDLVKFAKKRGIPLDRPWRELSAAHRAVGHRRRRPVEQGRLVRREALLRVAGDQVVQDARARAACRAIARTRPAPRATARASRPKRCCGASAAASWRTRCWIPRSASAPRA